MTSKIARGIYAHGSITPESVLHAVFDYGSGIAATGITAAQLHLEQELTLPLHLAGTTSLPTSEYYIFHRTRALNRVKVGRYYTVPPVAVLQHLPPDAPAGIGLLEHYYRGRRGRAKFEKDLGAIKRLAPHARAMITAATFGMDSGAEAKVIGRLKALGIEAFSNVHIGEYSWDIVIPAWRVAIEIDSHGYHSELDAFIKDRWKNNDATLRGWTTLRYSGSCVAHHLDRIIEQILAANPKVRTSADAPAPQGPVWNWHVGYLRYTNPKLSYAFGAAAWE